MVVDDGLMPAQQDRCVMLPCIWVLGDTNLVLTWHGGREGPPPGISAARV